MLAQAPIQFRSLFRRERRELSLALIIIEALPEGDFAAGAPQLRARLGRAPKPVA